MKQKHIIPLFAIGLIVAGGVAFFNLWVSNNCSANDHTCQIEQKEVAFTNKNVQLFQENAIQETIKAWKLPALYFKANWCLNCKLLEDELKEKGFPDGIDIYEVDFDQAKDLREKYSVNNQHTLILLNDKEEEIWRDMSWDYTKVIETIKQTIKK